MAAVVFDEATVRILEKESNILLSLIFDMPRNDRKSRVRVSIGNSLGFLRYQGMTYVDALVNRPEGVERAVETELHLFLW